MSFQLTKINGGAPEVVLQFGCRKKVRGGAFPFGALASIALGKKRSRSRRKIKGRRQSGGWPNRCDFAYVRQDTVNIGLAKNSSLFN